MRIRNQIWLTASFVALSVHFTQAQTTAWTYQGRLGSGATNANGSFDFQFAIFNASSLGAQQGPTLTNSAVGVTNGLFTTTLDFGPGVFTGPDRWLEMGVRSNGAATAFSPLAPRQRITPTPYALYASNATVAATASGLAPSTVSAAQFNTPGGPGTGQVLAYNGSGLVWTNASAVSAAWTLTGNAGTAAGPNFIGTTDNQPLELKANAVRAMRVEPNTNLAPNVIGGAPNNFVLPGTVGAVIGGGGASNYNTGVLGIGLSPSNAIRSDFGVIAGGVANTIQSGALYGTVAGGFNNSLGSNSSSSVIGGGYSHVIGGSATAAVIAGGDQNVIEPNASFSSIGGGGVNYIRSGAYESVIAGGEVNSIQTNAHHAAIGGGVGNQVSLNGITATIPGGSNNLAGAAAAVVGGGAQNRATGNYSTIGGGYLNTNTTTFGVVGGGSGNRITASFYATIGGGSYNLGQNDYGTVGGGLNNTNAGNGSTIGGGQQNLTLGGVATVPGGTLNVAGGDYSLAAGRRAKANHLGSFVWADSDGGSSFGSDFASSSFDQFLIRAGGGVGINTNNPAGAALAVVGGIRNGAGGTTQSRVQFGTANVGTGTNGVNTFTINFPTAFTSVPKVFVMTRGNDNPDTFAISTRAVTTSSFKVNIIRVDIASGWGQPLNVDWYATE